MLQVNCGHTFCHHCITVWRAKKPSCPVCRADIKQLAACKVSASSRVVWGLC